VTSVAEERRYNPRLGGEIDEADFIGYMSHLGLPHPKLIDIAVPANLRCGQPEKDTALPAEPGWAPLTFTFAGIWEIHPDALEENAENIQIVDVREADEYHGPLGHIRGAKLIPLGTLPARAGELARDRPVVAVCRSGARSAQASVLLQRAGFDEVANLAGGMLRWRAEGHSVEEGQA
jgi:rhodanese-related sulfurtransferase